MRGFAVLAASLLTVSASEGLAVSQAVKDACTSDYAAYCSEHKVGTEALRSCMRAHRKMLTAGCIKALGHSNEVTKEDIRQYKAEMRKQ